VRVPGRGSTFRGDVDVDSGRNGLSAALALESYVPVPTRPKNPTIATRRFTYGSFHRLMNSLKAGRGDIHNTPTRYSAGTFGFPNRGQCKFPAKQRNLQAISPTSLQQSRVKSLQIKRLAFLSVESNRDVRGLIREESSLMPGKKTRARKDKA